MIVEPTGTAGRAAAEWWGDQVRAIATPAPDTASPGNQRGEGLLERLHHRMATGGTDVTDAMVRAFIDGLTQRVEDSPTVKVVLSTDYTATGLLADAADAAGIPRGCFPAKTVSQVFEDHVLVWQVRRSQPHVIWSAPGWDSSCPAR